MRVISPDGEPVTEEQELRLRLPADWAERAGDICPAVPPQPKRRR
jgi:hypothetical protein